MKRSTCPWDQKKPSAVTLPIISIWLEREHHESPDVPFEDIRVQDEGACGSCKVPFGLMGALHGPHFCASLIARLGFEWLHLVRWLHGHAVAVVCDLAGNRGASVRAKF